MAPASTANAISGRSIAPLAAGPGGEGAWFTTLREPRLLSAAQRREGPRTAYVGSEVTVSIVDQDEAPYSSDLQQLAVHALCSNRDLPLLMATAAGGPRLALAQEAPVASIQVLKGPSRPLPPAQEGHGAWQLVNQLTFNHIGITDSGHAARGAATLREVLTLYLPDADPVLQRQIEGLRELRSIPVTRRLDRPGPLAFGRGVQIDIEVDEFAFQGGSAYLFASVLARFMARHASINSFVQTRMTSATRGLIYAGPALCGTRPIL